MLVVYLVTDLNGLGQIKIVPCYPAVIHAVKSRIKSAGNVHNNAVGIFLDKISHQLVQNYRPCNNSVAHGRVAVSVIKIIIQLVNNFNSLCVIKLAILAFRVFCTCIKLWSIVSAAPLSVGLIFPYYFPSDIIISEQILVSQFKLFY